MSDTTITILDAALGVFGANGFHGTTISLIAEASGVSRPTVYARYKNKEEVFRAVYQRVFDLALADVCAVLARDRPLDELLSGALLAYFGRLYEVVLSFERADELIAEQDRLAADIMLDASTRVRAAFVGALERHGNTPRSGATVDELVDILTLAPRAFKDPAGGAEVYHARLRLLANLVARDLCSE